MNTDKSRELELVGSYLLEVGSFHLVLRDGERKAMLYEWPFEKIRRYGKDTGTFTFESGRKCQTGEGLFILNTVQGDEIFEMVRSKLAIIRTRRKEDQQGANAHSNIVSNTQQASNAHSNTVSNTQHASNLRSNTVTNIERKQVSSPSKTAITSKPLARKLSPNSVSGTGPPSTGQNYGRASAIKCGPNILRRRSNEERAKSNDYESAAGAHDEPQYSMSQLVEKAAQLGRHLADGGAAEDGYEQIDFKHPMKGQRFDAPITEQSPNLYDEQSTMFRAEASSEEESIYAQEYYDVKPSEAPSDGDYSTVYQHWQKPYN